MALIDGLISYWKLDEPSGTRADAHGGNSLTDNNAVGSATGKINAAANFDGTNDYLNRADNADLSFADDAFTIAAWLSLDDLSAIRCAVGKWASDGAVATCEYALRFLNSAFRFNWRVGDGTNNSNVTANAAGPPSTGVLYFVAVWHDPAADQIGISVNAGTAETASHSTGVLDGAASFTLGRTGDFDGQYWDGLIDEVGVWGRVLSSSEISQLYNSGAGLAYPFGATAGPLRRRRPAGIEPVFEYSW